MGLTTLSILIGIQAPLQAATMSGSFSFMGKSLYYGWKFKKDCTDPKNKVTIDTVFNLDTIEENGKKSIDPKGRNEILFTQKSTDCSKAKRWNGTTYTVDVTNAEFGKDWQITKIDFKKIVDKRNYPTLGNPHDPGKTFKPKDGTISGFFDFEKVDAKLLFTYTDVLDPKNPKTHVTDDIDFITKPKLADVPPKKTPTSYPGTPIPPEELGRSPGNPIPEPSSVLSLLTLGTIGTGAALKRKSHKR